MFYNHKGGASFGHWGLSNIWKVINCISSNGETVNLKKIAGEYIMKIDKDSIVFPLPTDQLIDSFENFWKVKFPEDYRDF